MDAGETFIAAKARNMRKDKHEKSMKGCGGFGCGETAVMTLLNGNPAKGGSKVCATLVVDARDSALQENIRHQVESGSAVRNDQLVSTWDWIPAPFMAWSTTQTATLTVSF